MPFRTRLKRFLGGSEGKEHVHTADEPEQTDGDKKPDDSHVETTELEPPLANAAHPKRFKLKGLWHEAYGQLREEDEQLIVAYEKDLLTQDMEQPGYSRGVLEDGQGRQLRHLVERRLLDIQQTRLRFTVGGREVMVKDQARRIIRAILSVKDFITTAVSSEPHAALAWAGVLVLLNPVSRAITQEEDAMNGFEQILNLLIRYRLLESTHVEVYTSTNSSSRPTKPLEEIHASLRAKTINIYKEVLRYQMRLAKQYSHSGLFRFLKDLVAADDWKDMLRSITEIDQSINEDLRTLGGHTLKEIDNRIEDLQRQMTTSLDLVTEARDEAKASKQLQLLEKLPYAEGAVFNSFEDRGKRHCLAGTQVEILTEIQKWIEEPDGCQIFWLRGMAGTGKSTISRTFAAASHGRTRLVTEDPLPDNLCLGASFFFNQYEPLRNNGKRLFTTLAWSMAGVLPSLKPLVCDAIDKHPKIGDESPENQWNYLIFQPLLALERRTLSTLTLIIVIDALDECKPDSDLSLILQLMSRVKDLRTIKIRLFLTSRPEAHIRSCFRGVSENLIHEAVLNKVTISGSEEHPKSDITRFLTHELAFIRQKNQIIEDWPGQANLQKLALKADGLFIYAATACRFLDGPHLTRTRLDLRLKMIFDDKVTGNSPQKNLDAIYTSILQFSVLGDAIDEEKAEISRLFKQVVGSIVVLFEPLSPSYLSELVNTPLQSLEETLKGLHSVLAVPKESNDTVQLLHLSFRDFLIDKQRCLDDNFCISEVIAHKALFQRSVEIMSNTLRRDICGLLNPATSISNVEQSRLSQHIPIHLQYACRYWAYHLQQSGVEPTDNDEVHQFLKMHLLHWLEAISLLGKMHEAVRMVIVLSDYLAILPPENKTELKYMVQDARRFVLKFRSLIESTPLQLYHSALLFCPKASIVRSLFGNDIPKWFHGMPTMDLQWDPLLQTLEPHDGDNVALTPDGKLVASPTGRIWDTSTGTLVKRLEPWKASGWVAFSQDGKVLISIAYMGNVMKWDVATGLLLLEISTGRQWVFLAVFSQARNMAATVSTVPDGTTITIIDVVGGRYVKRERAHSRHIIALALSPDGACLATGSEDETLCLWDTTTGELRRTLRGHRDGVSAVAFSPDGQLVASVAMDNIKLWHSGTGTLSATIEYPTGIRHLAFSPDSTLLASTGSDGRLRLWEAATGALLRRIDCDFSSPLFSPKGDLLTSTGARKGRTTRLTDGLQLWETETRMLAKVVTDHGHRAYGVSFSSDGTVMASATRTEIQLWDLTLKANQLSSTAHSHSVSSIALTLNAERAVSLAMYDSVMLWDVNTGDLLSTTSARDVQSPSMVVVSPDGALMVTPSSRKNIEVLDLRTGKLLQTLTGHIGMISTMRFTSDSRILASASLGVNHNLELGCIWHGRGDYGEDNPNPPDPSIRLWDAKNGELLQTLNGPGGCILCLSFTIDGRILAAAYDNGIVHLWHTTTGELCQVLEGHTDAVMDVTFSSDGKIVASTCHDKTMRLWDMGTGKLIRILEYPQKLSVARFSPNGRLLATASDVDEVHLWNPATGELLGLCKGMGVDSISFSEDGQFLDTNMGQLSIEMICPSLPTLGRSKGGQGIFVRNPWVLRGTEKILLLPHEYRATCAAYRDGVLAMGHEHGHITIVEFDQDEMGCV